jgi:L-ribulose-5-phosphate 3-epimerase
MLKGISYWSFPGGLANQADYETVFKQARKLGFQSVEAAIAPSGVLTFDSSERQCRDIRAAARATGVAISSVATGVYWGCSLTASDSSVRKQAVDYTLKMLQVARWLETDAVLVVPGAVDVFFDANAEHVPYDVCWKRSAASLNACLPLAKKLRVTICLENVWNKFLLTPLEMARFIDQFHNPFIKTYLDLGNTMLNGYPQDWIHILGARRLGRIHIKDFAFRFYGGGEKGPAGRIAAHCRQIARGAVWAGAYAFCDLGAGDLPWEEAVMALKKAGYKGTVTAEMLPPGPGVLQRTSKSMDRLFQGCFRA